MSYYGELYDSIFVALVRTNQEYLIYNGDKTRRSGKIGVNGFLKSEDRSDYEVFFDHYLSIISVNTENIKVYSGTSYDSFKKDVVLLF